MAQRDLIEAVNDCIDRLNNGATVADCLRAYPQYAAELRVMLDAGRLVNRARIDPFEVQAAQARGRAHLREMLESSPPRNNITPFRRLVTLAASVVLILGVFLGGAGLAAETSLPGDPLYGLKRLTEDVRLFLPGTTNDLREAFARRRIDESRQLLAINRAESVAFSGEVENINGESWVVAGLPVTVPAGTPGSEAIKVSDVVAVQAHTTASGELVADSLMLVETGEVLPTVTPTVVPTNVSTQTPPPTVTPSSTLTLSPTPTATPTAAVLTTPTPCVPAAPTGWISYQVASGDTLSGLANATGVLVDDVMAVNCLQATTIFVGQRLFLPFAPQIQVSPAQSQPSSGAASGSPSPTNGSDDDEDEHNDEDDEDRSGSNSGSG